MSFEWDEAKNRENVEKHGISFLQAAVLFDGRPRIEEPSDQKGEGRWKTTGMIGGKHWTIIYTRRGERVRIISVRRARKNERRAYHQIFDPFYGGDQS